ncbi:MAG: hypothetical protein ACRDJC_17270, partial [Thermomicrobiales bacterium]
MDDRLREALTGLLDAIRTRRGAVRDAVAGATALTLIAAPDDAEAVKRRKKKRRRRRNRRKRCRGGTTRCPLVGCVNLNTDPQNCGRCGRECDAGEACRDGVCGCDVCDDEDACPFQSVQAAVDAATAGDTITVCKGSFDGNVTIDKDLTLVGAGSDDTKLEGEDGGSVVTVADGVTATIQGVSISGGTGSPNEGFLEGGGVFNRGTLTLVDAAVTNNQAERGGGTLNFSEAELTLDNSVVADNEAVSDAPGATFGGGILNLFGARLVVRNGSAIVDNRSLNSAGIHNNGILEAFDSLVANNDAEFDGAGIINDEGDITLNNTVVRDNEAAQGRGGGILNLGFDLRIESGSEISENKAGTNGGGIFNEPVGRVSIADSAILDNEATADGGSIYNNGGQVTLTRTVVARNDADFRGAGVFISGVGGLEAGRLTLEATTIRD